MVTVFVCDDSEQSRESYARILTQVAEQNKISVTVSAFAGGEELVYHLSESPSLPDIIYMDVLMQPINGIETAKQLRRMGVDSEIIFLTATRDYVFEAFDVVPIQYLLKDSLEQDRFEQVFLKAVERSRGKRDRVFVCDSGNARKIIPVREISFFEIWKRIIVVHFENGDTFEFYGTMEQLEQQLASQTFVRTHRSYLVNMQYVSKFHPQSVQLKTGETIPVGVTHVKRVKEIFSQYVSQHSVCDL